MSEISLAEAREMTVAQRAGLYVRLLDPDGDRTGQTSLVPAAAVERYISKGFRPLEPVARRRTTKTVIVEDLA